MEYNAFIKEAIQLALREDLGHGDVTSAMVVPPGHCAEAVFIAKGECTLAGMPFVKTVFDEVDSSLTFEIPRQEGDFVKKGAALGRITGNARAILAGERVALNILQHLSGVATLTHRFVEKVEGLSVKIVDTRKTMPGMRFMEKYAVKIGGGSNHRFGLYDGILIKDNHIAVAGGIRNAIMLAQKAHHLLKIEVEVKNIDELKEAIESGADVIMLDNMTVQDMRHAVEIARAAKGDVILEASGNVTIERVRAIAETGVDIISIGALTHSARAADINMKIKLY